MSARLRLPGSPWRRHRAFTLVEVVMVIGMIALLASIAIPRYDGAVAQYRADLAARRIAADLQLTRAEARATGKSLSVTFDLAGQSYDIVGLPDWRHPSQDYHVNVNETPYHATLLKVSFAGATTATFNAYGVPSAAGAVVVTAGAATRTVTLEADSGTATVQ